jgi:hypothetical protein
MKEIGYVEGENVAIEYRWAENRSDRIPARRDGASVSKGAPASR